jgi:hypothetical protein
MAALDHPARNDNLRNPQCRNLTPQRIGWVFGLASTGLVYTNRGALYLYNILSVCIQRRDFSSIQETRVRPVDCLCRSVFIRCCWSCTTGPHKLVTGDKCSLVCYQTNSAVTFTFNGLRSNIAIILSCTERVTHILESFHSFPCESRFTSRIVPEEVNSRSEL